MNTNCKQVRDAVKAHILEYYDIEELRENADAVKYGGVHTDYHAIKRLVEGGCFLIYYGDIKEFLNGLGINPNQKEYPDEKSWELYKHLVAINGARLLK